VTEFVIRIVMAASQEYVNTYSTHRVPTQPIHTSIHISLRSTSTPAARRVLVATTLPSGPIHRRFIYEGDTSTHAQGTDTRVALGA